MELRLIIPRYASQVYHLFRQKEQPKMQKISKLKIDISFEITKKKKIDNYF